MFCIRYILLKVKQHKCYPPYHYNDIIQVERMIQVMDDKQVIIDILNGNRDRYSVLMDKYHNEIFSFVFNMLGNYQDTEDIVQEIFFKTYQALPKYNYKKAGFRTWLYRIASNHTINFLNLAHNRYNSISEVDVDLLMDDTNIEQEIIKDEQMNTILQAMKRILSTKHQNIVSLHYFSGLSVKEISEALEIPEKTIYKALKTSIEKLQKEVTTNG